MMATPAFSVIVLNWNGERFLRDCFHALRQQSFQDFETILVDNASSDGSLALVEREFPEVQVVPLPQNIGLTGNVIGYEHSQGQIVVLLNNDTAVAPGWLEALHEAAQEFPTAGSFACKMMYFNDRARIDNCGAGVNAAGASVAYGRDQLDSPEFQMGRWVFAPCGGASAHRRTVLREIGFIDTDFFLTYDDLDLAFRTQLAGYKCRFVPEALVYHHYHGTIGGATGKLPARRVYFAQRSIEWVYIKNMPGWLILRHLHQRMLYEAGAAAYFASHGCFRAFVRAKLAAYRQLPKFLRKRRAIQKVRKISARELHASFDRGWVAERWRKMVGARTV